MGGFNYVQMIGAELQKADQLAAEIPEQIGMFTVKTGTSNPKERAKNSLLHLPEKLFQMVHDGLLNEYFNGRRGER